MLFFLGNIGQENMFYDILERKNAFLGKSLKIEIFPKGLTHGFGHKLAIFHLFFRPACLWGVLFKMATTTIVEKTLQELKEVSSRYVKQNLCRNELLDFLSRDFIEYAWS